MVSVALLLAAASIPASPDAVMPAQAAACADIVPSPSRDARARPLQPQDLVRLRDIGPVESTSTDARLFTVSPDGGRVAFQLRRADPKSNGYCHAMVVLELRPGARPRIVDTGGEFLSFRFDNRGKAGFPTGIARPITPRWSRDGKWIYFLKRLQGRTQVWRATPDGDMAEQVTEGASEVEDFRLTADGRALIYATSAALDAATEAFVREGRSGFHFDARFAPSSGFRPFPAAPLPRTVEVRDLESGAVRPATAAEAALLPASPTLEVGWSEALAADGRRAILQVPAATFFPSRGRLVVDGPDGHRATCMQSACADASRPWWTTAGDVRFFRREGWANASTAIYQWTPGPSAPRRLLVTEDVLADCAPDGDTLLCLRESSLEPRRLERLDPVSGRRALVFDPNPEFRDLRLGRAERLQFRNASGQETIADLVLPAGFRPGTRYPLIAVQYDTRGFLRGGTGDDYPIQAFANRGYAVLSVSRPSMAGIRSGSANVVAVERGNLAGFSHQRGALSSIETGARLAVERGIADPARIGLTGMSDGATIASWGILHSKLFSAMAMSQCCFDESFLSRVGPQGARHFEAVGYPRMTEPADAFWNAVSLVRNARRIAVPILLQLSDDEAMSALPTFTALREVDGAIDMFVFPDERHVKWQPAHRLAMYRRSLDWFDFWLRDRRSSAPDRHEEISRWAKMRQALRARRPD